MSFKQDMHVPIAPYAFFLNNQPIGWYCMNKWLEDFACRISMGQGMFAVAGVIALFIAFATISVHALKAALTNAVKNLRTE